MRMFNHKQPKRRFCVSSRDLKISPQLSVFAMARHGNHPGINLTLRSIDSHRTSALVVGSVRVRRTSSAVNARVFHARLETFAVFSTPVVLADALESSSFKLGDVVEHASAAVFADVGSLAPHAVSGTGGVRSLFSRADTSPVAFGAVALERFIGF